MLGKGVFPKYKKQKTTHHPPKEVEKYARIANEAYQTVGGRKRNLKGLQYLPNESGSETAVYFDPIEEKYIISSRGTTLKEEKDHLTGKNKVRDGVRNVSTALKDIGTDALVAFGMSKLSTRYKNLSRKTDRLVEKYGKDNVVLVGHSLGGRLAEDIAIEKHLTSKVFNAGTSPVDYLYHHENEDKYKNSRGDHTHYRIKGDPISMSTARNNDVIIEGKREKDHPHSITQFFIDEE